MPMFDTNEKKLYVVGVVVGVVANIKLSSLNIRLIVQTKNVST
jgi:hypothetical protein